MGSAGQCCLASEARGAWGWLWGPAETSRVKHRQILGRLAFIHCFENPRGSSQMASFPETYLIDFLVQSCRIGWWLFAPFFLLLHNFHDFFPHNKSVIVFAIRGEEAIKAILIKEKKL